jgi:hypothetical protein
MMSSEFKEAGLEHRYDITHRNDPEGKHNNCAYFVLDISHDPLARKALITYLEAADEDGQFRLAEDLRELLGRTITTPVSQEEERDRLLGQRDKLIASGVDPANLEVPRGP